MKIKANAKANYAVSILCSLLLSSNLLARHDPPSLESGISSHSTPLLSQDDLLEEQQSFLSLLEAAIATGNEQDILSIIVQFADSGNLFDETFVQAFHVLTEGNFNKAKERLSQYFTKPMIEKLSSKDKADLCSLLLKHHSEKYHQDLQMLVNAQNNREPFFKLLLHCMRNISLENQETASLLVTIDSGFMSPRLLAQLINQRSKEQMIAILENFCSYDLVTEEVFNDLNDQAKEIVTGIDLNFLLQEAEIGTFSEEDPGTFEPMDSDNNPDSADLANLPKLPKDQIIKQAKESPEAMMAACINAINGEDILLFSEILMEAYRTLDSNQFICLLDYAAKSGSPLFVAMVSQVLPNFDEIHLISAKSKSILLAVNHSWDLAISVASAYWNKVSQDNVLDLSEEGCYQSVLEEVYFGLVEFISFEEYPPYSRNDLKTLKDHLTKAIQDGKMGANSLIDSEIVFEACKSWGEKLKKYGLVASMKTEKP